MGEFTRADRHTIQKAQEVLLANRIANGTATRTEHARVAVRRGGRRARCTECGHREKIRTWSGRRLRSFSCPECGGRYRPENWAGFDPVTS